MGCGPTTICIDGDLFGQRGSIHCLFVCTARVIVSRGTQSQLSRMGTDAQ